MIDEPTHLEKHDPFWVQHFIQEQERIRVTLHVDSTAIQHIGSTAVSDIYLSSTEDSRFIGGTVAEMSDAGSDIAAS